MRSRSRVRISFGSGLSLVAVATALAGIVGYGITWLVPRVIGFNEYAAFAAFWAFMFLIAATLSGIQHEITRAVHPRVHGPAARGPWAFAAVTAALVMLLILGSAPLWGESVFPKAGWALVVPLAIGAASYVFVATITGILYGLSRWREVFWIVVCEAGLRLVAVALALVTSASLTALAWAVALPFGATAAIVVITRRQSLFSSSSLDVSVQQMVWNIGRTVTAAASMGILISGFPLVLTITSRDESTASIGFVILTSTLVRAPLIVTAMALQSYLIIHFRDLRGNLRRRVFAVESAISLAGVALGALGWLVGPTVFAVLFPGESVPAGWFIGALVISSSLVAALCVTASAVLSRSAHLVFASGWICAAVTTTALLLLPVDLVTRTLIALSVGPLVGLLVHGVYLASLRTREASHQPGTRSR